MISIRTLIITAAGSRSISQQEVRDRILPGESVP
jgi:hypothetical protein